MQENNLLSIFIPTFNRAHLIGETLDSFIIQVAKYGIPIVISDNCSTDDTYNVIAKYREKYPFIKYHKNAKNLGFDGNVAKMGELVNSKYCWLFGDDDLINEGAIDKVLKRIDDDYDLIIANASLSSLDLSVQFSYRHLLIDEDRKYNGNEIDKAFTDLISYTSFIGGLIVKKKLWDSIDYSKYMNTGFIHVGTAFEYLDNSSNVYLISDPLTNIRLGNSGWSTNSFEILFVLWDKTIFNLPNFTNELKNKAYRNYREFSYVAFLIERAKGTFRYNEYTKYIKNDVVLSKTKKVSLFLILGVPIIVLKKLFIVYLNYRKPVAYEYQVYLLRSKKINKTKYL
ncbi:glycosyltransferase family 2 protein [Flavobacterium yafengii]|uniref:glycosyltransferase family 2 protein n=1 Tax=Flavobacterium yafengii TaxID=3041253 RepID=UPI0024A92EEF|nr:glycosyltransferase family 2 protein [Flavobacterium yafengii]MDI5899191.1 glycosyltransferase family 2 protein [Flavobacterium yafengii]